MNKQAFLSELSARLNGLPQENIDERLTFYSEMIDDRMEEGLTEEEAVAEIGSVDDIAAQINAEIAAAQEEQPTKQPPKRRIWMLFLTFPIWIAAFVLIYAYGIFLLWALLIYLWAAFAGLVAGALASVIMSIVFVFRGYPLSALFVLGGGMVCAGLSVFLFLLALKASKGLVKLTKKIAMVPVKFFKWLGGLS